MKFLTSLCLSLLLLSSPLIAEQKVVLISGATSGVGLAAAKEFQKKGGKFLQVTEKRFPLNYNHSRMSILSVST